MSARFSFVAAIVRRYYLDAGIESEITEVFRLHEDDLPGFDQSMVEENDAVEVPLEIR